MKLLEISSAFEALRQRLGNNLGLETAQAFNSIDFNKDGEITANDLRKSFDMEGIAMGNAEIELLLARFGIKSKKKLDFFEFARSINPISSLVY